MINIGEVKMEKTERVNVGKRKQYTRVEIREITSRKFCKRHNVKSIKEYQDKIEKLLKEYRV